MTSDPQVLQYLKLLDTLAGQVERLVQATVTQQRQILQCVELVEVLGQRVRQLEQGKAVH